MAAKARTKSDALTLDFNITLKVHLQERASCPMPYHEIGRGPVDEDRETRLGIGMTLVPLYFFIGEDRFCLSMQELAEQLIPRMLELPTKDGVIDRTSEGLADLIAKEDEVPA